MTRLRRRLVGEQIWMIGTHHPTIPREARHATLAHGSRHSIRGALWVRQGRGWPPCWGGGVACAHTPNIASQPSAHHCLKSTTKTNTNQYIGQIRPLENHKAHKSAQAPKFRLGLPERSMGDLSGRPCSWPKLTMPQADRTRVRARNPDLPSGDTRTSPTRPPCAPRRRLCAQCCAPDLGVLCL